MTSEERTTSLHGQRTKWTVLDSEVLPYCPFSCSIASDSISQGHLLQDEDSLMSDPTTTYSHLGDDDKAELLRMLEEASCSSSNDSEEEEDISE